MTEIERGDSPSWPRPIELSVVIPMFNAANTIGHQLSALLSQQWSGPWEVIVADNGSSDGGRALVSELASREERLSVVDASDRRGPAHARNAGVSRARGAALAFCDADDVVKPGWLAAMGEALRVHAAVTGPQEQDLLNEPAFRNVYGGAIATRSQEFAGVFPFGPSANLGVTRAVFDEVGGFDPAVEVGEDMDFCLRLWHAGYQLVFEPTVAIHYRNRSSLGALFHQAGRYGAAGPLIVKRMTALGHHSPPRWRGIRNWLWLVREVPTLRTQHGRARWCVVAGGAIGRLLGSLRFRTFYS